MELTGPFRKIIHVDMDAFYASVEQLDNPELKGKALAVGGSEKRGVVSASSFVARKYGVRSAMSGLMAKQKCPHLIFVKPRFARYKEISSLIRQVFYEYSDLVEPLSLDEAFIDVTTNKKGNPSATLIAKEIRARILEVTGLNASAGISINKFTAKIASDINKPNGQKTIPPEQVVSFLEELPIHKFFGIGKVTSEKMKKIGIYFGKDLKQYSEQFLTERFGKAGKHYYQIVRGIHLSEVKPNRIRKSIAAERTFLDDISSESFIIEKIEKIAEELEKRLMRTNVKGKTITLKIKYNDFSKQTRSKTLEEFIQTKDQFLPTVIDLLKQDELKSSVRLLGISISNLNNKVKKEEKPVHVQLELEF